MFCNKNLSRLEMAWLNAAGITKRADYYKIRHSISNVILTSVVFCKSRHTDLCQPF